jgi:hypothetical protein
MLCTKTTGSMRNPVTTKKIGMKNARAKNSIAFSFAGLSWTAAR